MHPRSESRMGSPVDADNRRSAAFFESAHLAFLAAQEAVGGSDRQSFKIGGYELCLRFAGRALIQPMTKALAHLAIESSESPDLTICIWDSASTQTPMIPPSWSTDDYGVQGLINGFNTDRFQTLLQLANNTLNMLDHRKNLGLYWIPDARHVTYYATISPLRTLLYWWMRRHGRQLVHAGAVGTADGGVLLPAKGGSGKSTTALACLEAGLLYAGDNNILLSTDERPMHAYSMYNSTALHAIHLEERLPHLLSHIENPEQLEEQNAFAFLHKRYPTQMATSLPVRAVLVPRATGHRDTGLSESSLAASLNALIPSTLFSLPGAGRETFEALVKLIHPLPHYMLNLGTDLPQVPRVISELLRTLL